MYHSPSQYKDFISDGRGLEETQEARCGKFIFCSVLLHLCLLFCFIFINHINRGYVHPGEKVVEVSLLNPAKRYPSVKPSSSMNDSVKEVATVKHVSVPITTMKKTVKPINLPEKSVVTKKETDLPEVNNESKPVITPEVVKINNDINPESVDGFISDVITVSDGNGQNNLADSIMINSTQVAEDNYAVSQGQQYIDENFYYVKDLITRNLLYPVVARRMKWQGTVEVSFVILETGNVENIRIVTSSGHSVLDKNVIAAIQQVQPFPPPPVVAEFTMPIKYTLKD